MDPITVTWNGPLTQESVTETPDETMTALEYTEALIESHAVPGVNHQLHLDGEPIPDDLEVEALGGERLFLRADPAALEADDAEVEAKPYTDLTKADLWSEVDRRRDAGRAVPITSEKSSPRHDELVAALEADDAEQAQS